MVRLGQLYHQAQGKSMGQKYRSRRCPPGDPMERRQFWHLSARVPLVKRPVQAVDHRARRRGSAGHPKLECLGKLRPKHRNSGRKSDVSCLAHEGTGIAGEMGRDGHIGVQDDSHRTASGVPRLREGGGAWISLHEPPPPLSSMTWPDTSASWRARSSAAWPS